jgi:cyclopropane fatty-acyl-phospholipid synthase-like methyltransferase
MRRESTSSSTWLQVAGVHQQDRVVDIGCGYGASARWLTQEFAARVTALTISPAQFAFASRVDPGAVNPTYLLRDWLENDLPSASCDCALAIESTEHMQNKMEVFCEIHRVLRPRGCLAVCAWIARESARPWEVRHLLEPICREGRLMGMGTESDYRAWIQAAGLEITTVEDLTAGVQRTWGRCIARVAAHLVRDPRYQRYLLDPRSRNRVFLLTAVRIWTAYKWGAMRYLLFIARRPECDSPAGRVAE